MKSRSIGLFLISAATLMLEIALTRLFSVMYFNHFAFLVISIALFGIAFAGTFLYIKRWKDPYFVSALLFSISVLVGFFPLNSLMFDPIVASVSLMHAARLLLFYVVLGIPFFFSGIIVAHMFSKYQKESGSVYFYNLSGAAFGSLGALPVISIIGEKVIIAVAVIGLLSSLFFTNEKKRLITAAALMVLFISLPIQINISPYKELQIALSYPNSEHVDTIWNSFSRVDVVKSSFTRYAPGLSSEYRDPLPEQVGILVDGGNMNAITEYKSPRFVEFLPTSVVFSLMDEPRMLVIDSGPGLDVLTGLYHNATVTAVESNPTVVELVQERYAEFSGDIYRKADVKTGNGRSILKNQDFDVIILSISGNVNTNFIGLSENYMLTEEAFQEYVDHLSDEGILIVTRVLSHPPRESLRLFSLALEIDPTAKNIAMFRSWSTVTLLLGKTEFSKQRIQAIREFTENKKYDIIYLPAQFEPNIYSQFKEPVYYYGVQQILESKDQFYMNYLFDVSPVNDDRPFYFNFFKLSKMRELYKIAGESWQPFLDPGFLLIFLLLQALLLGIIFIILPVFTRHRRHWSSRLWFFLFIGLGYLFIEIFFIQKMALPLGHIAYSISTVIFAMLFCSSLGSLFSQRKQINMLHVLISICCLVVVYWAALPYLSLFIIKQTLLIRFTIVSILISPIAFMMGMPFPIGIRVIKKEAIPWAWAINGSASVVSSILAIFIAIYLGYNALLIMAGLTYLIAYFTIRA